MTDSDKIKHPDEIGDRLRREAENTHRIPAAEALLDALDATADAEPVTGNKAIDWLRATTLSKQDVTKHGVDNAVEHDG